MRNVTLSCKSPFLYETRYVTMRPKATQIKEKEFITPQK